MKIRTSIMTTGILACTFALAAGEMPQAIKSDFLASGPAQNISIPRTRKAELALEAAKVCFREYKQGAKHVWDNHVKFYDKYCGDKTYPWQTRAWNHMLWMLKPVVNGLLVGRAVGYSIPLTAGGVAGFGGAQIYGHYCTLLDHEIARQQKAMSTASTATPAALPAPAAPSTTNA